jgi:hypothetical protein
LPFLGLFAWNYRQTFIGLKREWRFRIKSKRSQNKRRGSGLAETIELRKRLFEKLDNILTKNTWKKE